MLIGVRADLWGATMTLFSRVGLLCLLGAGGVLLALLLNGVFLWEAVDIWRKPTNTNIWRLYKYSLLFLALLFLAMGIDHLCFTIPPGALNFSWSPGI